MNFKYLLFDLDNTLYPSTSAMDAGITRRMMECVAEFFSCSMEEAIKIRKKNISHYSTTLEWLRAQGLKDIEKYLAHVHPDNECDELKKEDGLRKLLLRLPQKKSILTNAPREHAQRVLEKLEVSDLFECITDIRDPNFFGKPYPQAYQTALKKSGFNFEETLFIDDMQKYTDGWAALGGTSILIGNKNGKPLSKDAKSMSNAEQKVWGQTYRLKSIYELPQFLGL